MTQPVIFNLPSNAWIWISILAIWSLTWKGIALWKSARNHDKAWFIALIILNTVGILDIFYIYVFSKREKTPQENKKVESK